MICGTFLLTRLLRRCRFLCLLRRLCLLRLRLLLLRLLLLLLLLLRLLRIRLALLPLLYLCKGTHRRNRRIVTPHLRSFNLFILRPTRR